MATVDLDKLSAELTAAGVQVLGRYHENTGGYLQVPVAAGSYLYVITDGSEPIDWSAIDIIRRHVAPVAPDLREAIATAIRNNRLNKKADQSPEGIASAVLAVLAERGVR